MRAQPKKTKKKKKGGEREISTVCPSRGECYKAVIMPENEKWNKVVGARKGEAETETKSWKFRAQRVRRKSRFITYAKQKTQKYRNTIKKTRINNRICIRLCQVVKEIYVRGGRRGQNAKIYTGSVWE